MTLVPFLPLPLQLPRPRPPDDRPVDCMPKLFGAAGRGAGGGDAAETTIGLGETEAEAHEVGEAEAHEVGETEAGAGAREACGSGGLGPA